MARSLCAERRRASLAAGAAVQVLAGGARMQLPALAWARPAACWYAALCPAHAGWAPAGPGSACLFRRRARCRGPGRRRHRASPAARPATCFRARALVFGGDHVVQPPVRDVIVPTGWLPDRQHIPRRLQRGSGATRPALRHRSVFSARPPPLGSAALWSAVALLSIFLPGIVLALDVLPHWALLTQHRLAQAGRAGVIASMVGMLGVAPFDPVWTSYPLSRRRGRRHRRPVPAGPLARAAHPGRRLLPGLHLQLANGSARAGLGGKAELGYHGFEAVRQVSAGADVHAVQSIWHRAKCRCQIHTCTTSRTPTAPSTSAIINSRRQSHRAPADTANRTLRP